MTTPLIVFGLQLSYNQNAIGHEANHWLLDVCLNNGEIIASATKHTADTYILNPCFNGYEWVCPFGQNVAPPQTVKETLWRLYEAAKWQKAYFEQNPVYIGVEPPY